MDCLDLRIAPPRPGRAELGSVVFLPRSIDKARAMLPGGSLGEYRMEGFTEDMLERLGISADDFISTVRDASSDEEVAAYVAQRNGASAIAAWNDYVVHRKPFGDDRAAAVARFPFLAERPDLVYALDVLEEDDRLTFAGR